MSGGLTVEAIDTQEKVLADAFRAGDIARAGHLYHPDVLYSSPTTRLYGWPRLIEGREPTLAFIQLTISGLAAIDYRLDERAVIDGESAYTRIFFDFATGDGRRLRSTYVVLYRYTQGLIARQELYYDPSDRLDESPDESDTDE